MIRTKEFLVFLTCCTFLLLAIVTTLILDLVADRSFSQTGALLASKEVELIDISVADETGMVGGNEENVLSMRERIQAYRASGGVDFDSFVLAEYVPEESGEDEGVVQQEGIQLCTQYQPYSGTWPFGVQIDEREGARIVYVVVDDQVPTGTSSVQMAATERILLQLPVHTQPRPDSRCLPSDVVGIAQDGSLIRNHEYGLYGIFDDSTVVGYALDGFPIYGQNNSITVDSCGGATISGQYGYVLQSNRGAILNCFKGTPAQL